MKLYPEDWKRELWAAVEALVSFGLLAAFFRLAATGFMRDGVPVRTIQLTIFGLIVLYAFSFGFALSACRNAKGFGRILGVVMLVLLAYVLLSFAGAHHRGRM